MPFLGVMQPEPSNGIVAPRADADGAQSVLRGVTLPPPRSRRLDGELDLPVRGLQASEDRAALVNRRLEVRGAGALCPTSFAA